MSRPNKILQLLISMIPVFLVISSEPSANAIVPQIQNIVVYNSGSDTILNITINHIPAGDPGHYVNFTQVTFSGTVHNFTVPFNLPRRLLFRAMLEWSKELRQPQSVRTAQSTDGVLHMTFRFQSSRCHYFR